LKGVTPAASQILALEKSPDLLPLDIILESNFLRGATAASP
jgi:hypothetical protein